VVEDSVLVGSFDVSLGEVCLKMKEVQSKTQ
jgi:hypothetical protein